MDELLAFGSSVERKRRNGKKMSERGIPIKESFQVKVVVFKIGVKN